MRILVTGATGFIGRALALRLRRDQHEVIALVRAPERARDQLGGEIELLPLATGDRELVEVMRRCDAVINLAGEPLVGRRWTVARRRALIDSRVGLTRRLVVAIEAADRPPRVLISGSAVGVYGDRGAERLDDTAAPGDDFLANLCRDWEAAALRAASERTRVVCLRSGVVIGRDGGALARMLPAFRAGVGGPIGDGRQYMSWIHLHDLVSVIAGSLTDDRVRGSINATSPEPVTSRELARALGRALRRPAVLPLPKLALRALFGASATVLTDSQRAVPAALDQLGFSFRHPDIAGALSDVLVDEKLQVKPVRGRPVLDGDTVDATEYLSRRRPRYTLVATTTVNAPIDEVFGFFSRPHNLAPLTPPSMGMRVSRVPDTSGAGAVFDYRLRLGPFGLTWRARIEQWEPPGRFIDSQLAGPYRAWWHEHRFIADGPRTIVEDRVLYAPPLGWFGRAINRLFVAGQLRRIFAYRKDALRLRFGITDRGPADTIAPTSPPPRGRRS